MKLQVIAYFGNLENSNNHIGLRSSMRKMRKTSDNDSNMKTSPTRCMTPDHGVFEHEAEVEDLKKPEVRVNNQVVVEQRPQGTFISMYI